MIFPLTSTPVATQAAHVRASATYYLGNQPDTHGRSMRQNERELGLVAACNRFPRGSRVLVCRWGQRGGAVFTVVDRIGHSSDFDAYGPRGARAVMGEHWRKVGRCRVTLRLVGKVKVGKVKVGKVKVGKGAAKAHGRKAKRNTRKTSIGRHTKGGRR